MRGRSFDSFYYFSADNLLTLCSLASHEIQEQEEISELTMKLQETYKLHESTMNELQSLKSEFEDQIQEKVPLILETR